MVSIVVSVVLVSYNNPDAEKVVFSSSVACHVSELKN